MSTPIRIWRALLWILGGVFVVPSAFLFWMEITDAEARQGRIESIALSGLCLLAAVLGPVAAVGMKRMSRWARPTCWIVATIQTLAFPVFTPVGLLGLILLYCGAGKSGTLPALQPSRRIGTLLLFPIAVLVLMPFIDGFFRWAKHLGYPNAPGPAIDLPILLACVLLQLTIHEGGHALAVKFVHGHIHRFQIGPLWWSRESGRTWMGFSRKFSSAGIVGWTPGLAHQFVRQRLLVSAAGPLVNLMCGLIALAAFPWLANVGLSRAWTGVMLLSISGFMILPNLWPSRKGHQDSDGATIFGLLTSGSFRRLCEVTLTQSMSDSSELRPREWSRTDLEWALALEDAAPFASQRSAILHAACAHYLDSGDFAEAVHIARRFQDLALKEPKRCSPNGFPEAVFTLAFYDSDPESARALWARRPAGVPVQFELAERLAAAAITKEDRQDAIRRAWECSGLFGSCGTLKYLREQLRRLEMGSPTSTPIVNPSALSERVGVEAFRSEPPCSQRKSRLTVSWHFSFQSSCRNRRHPEVSWSCQGEIAGDNVA